MYKSPEVLRQIKTKIYMSIKKKKLIANKSLNANYFHSLYTHENGSVLRVLAEFNHFISYIFVYVRNNVHFIYFRRTCKPLLIWF